MVNKKRKDLKLQSLIELGLVIGLIIVANLISSAVFMRADLTKEKRFSLSSTTKELAKKLDDVLYVKVYLKGDFPADFKRLRNATQEMLDEFRAISKNKIEYEFVDPFEGVEKKGQLDVLRQLSEKGLQPTQAFSTKVDEEEKKIIVPGALCYFKDKEMPLNLLKKQDMGEAPEEVINKSIEGLEYEIGNILRKCVAGDKPKLAFLTGHGELNEQEVGSISYELSEFYEVQRFDLTAPDSLQSLNKFAGIIIAKPTEPFSEFHKFKIDQYVMNGGKVLWLVDPVFANIDSLRRYPEMLSISYDLRLDDMLFKYGVRLNQDLIQDMKSGDISLTTGFEGSSVQQRKFRWIFYPLFSSSSQHPIVRNIDAVHGQFVSSIDTTANKKISKTVLLQSSENSRVQNSPVRISFEILRRPINPALFNKPYRMSAVLLEGEFESVFRYRQKAGSGDADLPFKESIAKNSMIVISDGDIIRNLVRPSGEIYPLGFDRNTGETFGNKKFIMNCIDYLCDGSGLIEVRTKEIKLRMLNKVKVKDEKMKWQLINMLLPIALILLFGGVNYYIRKKRYAS
jgi:ABC-2 type transport system permease protein